MPDYSVLVPKEVQEMVRLFETLDYDDLKHITRNWPVDRYRALEMIVTKSAEEREKIKRSGEWRELFLDIEDEPGVLQIMALMYTSDETRNLILEILKEKFESP
ncbi:MAG: hypothetical protein Q8P58_00050 [Candidatus Adlerbacteria bacterium]|nr:hypothetical protein [Candidatus Adlerbacteria bacterium]